MYLIFEKRYLGWLLTLLIAAAAAKIVWAATLFLLSPSCPTPPVTSKKSGRDDTVVLSRLFRGETSAMHTKPMHSLQHIALKALFKKGNRGFALLHDDGKDVYLDLGQRYRGYRLTEIGRDGILLEKGGKHYKLLLAGTKALKGKIIR